MEFNASPGQKQTNSLNGHTPTAQRALRGAFTRNSALPGGGRGPRIDSAAALTIVMALRHLESSLRHLESRVAAIEARLRGGVVTRDGARQEPTAPRRILRGVVTRDSAFPGGGHGMTSELRVDAARHVPIEEIARLARIERTLKRSGAEFVGPCPKCGGTDRFAINRKEQVWNCRGCDKGGDGIALVMHIQGCDFQRAIEWLTPGFIEPEASRTEFAFCDPESGQARYRKIRLDIAGGKKKIWFEPKERGGSAPLLYGGERLADCTLGEVVFVVEGENKVDRHRELGFAAVSADAGAKSHWLPEHGRLFRGLAPVLWPDSDAAGEGVHCQRSEGHQRRMSGRRNQGGAAVRASEWRGQRPGRLQLDRRPG